MTGEEALANNEQARENAHYDQGPEPDSRRVCRECEGVTVEWDEEANAYVEDVCSYCAGTGRD